MGDLQTKIIKELETTYKAFVTNVIVAGKEGTMDLIVCIEGEYFAFEIKDGNDKPSALQYQQINEVINAGGKAYIIKSVSQLKEILNLKLKPIQYNVENIFLL